MLKRGFLAWLVVASSALAQPGLVARREVKEIKPLMIEAIDSPQGQAYGRLTGELVDAIGRQFRTSAPINVDVVTLVRYAEEGCRRLSVLIWQEGVRLRQGDPGGRQSVEFGINYCRSGLPPQSLKNSGEP
jgi:hypothetical protein